MKHLGEIIFAEATDSWNHYVFDLIVIDYIKLYLQKVQIILCHLFIPTS